MPVHPSGEGDARPAADDGTAAPEAGPAPQEPPVLFGRHSNSELDARCFGLHISQDAWLYYFTLAVGVAIYVFSVNLLRSRSGRAFMAKRQPQGESAFGQQREPHVLRVAQQDL